MVDACESLAEVLTVEEIETLSALVGDYNFEASLKCLVDIAERLELRLGSLD